MNPLVLRLVATGNTTSCPQNLALPWEKNREYHLIDPLPDLESIDILSDRQEYKKNVSTIEIRVQPLQICPPSFITFVETRNLFQSLAEFQIIYFYAVVEVDLHLLGG